MITNPSASVNCLYRCSDIECEPPHGGKEDCELNQKGFCSACGLLMKQLLLLPDSPTGPSWREIIFAELMREPGRYRALDMHLSRLYATSSVNPSLNCIFKAFSLCPAEQTKVVILGQDPYPNKSHAMGLSFSIPAGEKQPPSLKNIFRELESDIGRYSQVLNGDLTPWAKQGVLLLNTSLTVEEGAPNSHKAYWDGFAENVLLHFNAIQKSPVVYILWGKQAGDIGKKLEKNSPAGAPRSFLYSVHPSPLAAYRGFFGSKPFSQTNAFLAENGASPIIW